MKDSDVLYRRLAACIGALLAGATLACKSHEPAPPPKDMQAPKETAPMSPASKPIPPAATPSPNPAPDPMPPKGSPGGKS